MNIFTERIENLRRRMKDSGFKAWIVPGTDPHMSEYLPKEWAERSYISGFTGSMGYLVFTDTKAGLWTDSRYFLQAEMQLKNTGIQLFKKGLKETPNPLLWIEKELNQGDIVGLNGLLFPVTQIYEMEQVFSSKKISIDSHHDLLTQLREEKGDDTHEIITLSEQYSGESTSHKLQRVRDNYQGDWLSIYSSLDQIAWLYNIRGKDVTYNPVAISYAILSPNKAYLFIDKNKVPEKAKIVLKKAGVEILPYEDLLRFLKTQSQSSYFIVDKTSLNHTVYQTIADRFQVLNQPSIINHYKSIKNSVELSGFKKAMISDGIALTRFMMWFDKAISKAEQINEFDIGVKLKEFRAQQEGFVDESFCTIASFNENGAIVHYSPPAKGSASIKKDGILLIDSGGQYLYGTTDITRTIATGKVSQEAKNDFTRVLQGHIGLATAVFPKGTCGVQLDVLARNKMWKAGLDYGHGTGHGVGHFLNVHEGPQTIRKEGNNIELEKNMVITIEPGIYRQDHWGLRVENMVYISEGQSTEFGSFLELTNLTLFPIDFKLINMNLLSNEEIDWLNHYHAQVFNGLSSYLNDEETNWLREKTRKF